MKIKQIAIVIILVLGALTQFQIVSAQGNVPETPSDPAALSNPQNQSQEEVEPFAGQVLCIPDVYWNNPQDCLAMGPSASLSNLAKSGLVVNPPPLPAYHPPASLAEIPYQYIEVKYKGGVPVANSLYDAAANNFSREIMYGFRYFSYSERAENPDGGIFYHIDTGEWVWGGYVSRVSPPSFQGFLFHENPKAPFGWIIDTTETRTIPDPNAPTTGHTVTRLDVVDILGAVRVENIDWYMIGINEWVQKNNISVINPNPLPPEGVHNQRWIEIDLYQQTLTVYDQGQLVFATLLSSGSNPFFTQPGLFQIYQKLESETMSSGNPQDYYFLEDVPYTMYYDQKRALHGAYWHSRFGTAHSHGCVNLSIADARWLFEWAHEGDWVYAWDPSGQTPTDPAYYIESGGY